MTELRKQSKHSGPRKHQAGIRKGAVDHGELRRRYLADGPSGAWYDTLRRHPEFAELDAKHPGDRSGLVDDVEAQLYDCLQIMNAQVDALRLIDRQVRAAKGDPRPELLTERAACIQAFAGARGVAIGLGISSTSIPFVGSYFRRIYRLNRAEKLLCMQRPYEAWCVYSISKGVVDVTKTIYGTAGHNNEADAFRHALWQFRITRELGAGSAVIWGDAHENVPGNPPAEREMDQHNNAIGRVLAENPSDVLGGNDSDYDHMSDIDLVLEAIKEDKLQLKPVKP